MNKIFKIVGWLEGLSCLILFGNMLITKHLNPELYQTMLFPVGMMHGLLFITYCILALMLKSEENWSYKKLFEVCIAAVFPFGTFYIERKYFRNAI